jgi:transposase
MYLCVLDATGQVVLHVNIPSTPEAFLKAIAPFRGDLVVGAECTLSWYWLADLCRAEKIEFLLGHALYMRVIHGAKAKNDKLDSLKIARLLRGGNFPMAYVYPSETRGTRDLLRRRLHFVRRRGELLAHIQCVHHQYNRVSPGKKIYYAANRIGITDGFSDPSATRSIELDTALIDHYDKLIGELELELTRRARIDDPQAFARLKTIPGVGPILAMTILYEVHDIARFPRVQEFVSYARLVRCQRESGGKFLGTGGSKIGNVHLKWAFSEAAVLFISKSSDGKRLRARLERKHGKGKSMSILAARLGRAAYYMLSRKQAFDATRFLKTG